MHAVLALVRSLCIYVHILIIFIADQACGTFLFTGQMILTPREIKDVDLAYEVTYREVTYQVKIAPVRSQSFDIQANPLEARTLFNTVFGQKVFLLVSDCVDVISC